MLDVFLQVVADRESRQEKNAQAVSLLSQLPKEELAALANGVKLAWLEASPSDSRDSWLGRFRDTPLYNQALALEQEELQLDIAESQQRKQSQGIWDGRDMVRIQKRLLELELQKAKAPLPPAPDTVVAEQGLGAPVETPVAPAVAAKTAGIQNSKLLHTVLGPFTRAGKTMAETVRPKSEEDKEEKTSGWDSLDGAGRLLARADKQEENFAKTAFLSALKSTAPALMNWAKTNPGHAAAIATGAGLGALQGEGVSGKVTGAVTGGLVGHGAFRLGARAMGGGPKLGPAGGSITPPSGAARTVPGT